MPLALSRRLWLFLPAEQERQGWRRLLTTLGTETVRRAEQRALRERQDGEHEDLLYRLVWQETLDGHRYKNQSSKPSLYYLIWLKKPLCLVFFLAQH